MARKSSRDSPKFTNFGNLELRRFRCKGSSRSLPGPGKNDQAADGPTRGPSLDRVRTDWARVEVPPGSARGPPRGGQNLPILAPERPEEGGQNDTPMDPKVGLKRSGFLSGPGRNWHRGCPKCGSISESLLGQPRGPIFDQILLIETLSQ